MGRMTERAFQKYYQRYYVERKLVQRIARKYSLGDPELYKDLVQEILMRLWSLNIRKAKTNVDSWIRQTFRNACIDYLRRNRPRKFESLDARLLAGEQIEQDPYTGDLRIITSRTDVLLDVEALPKPKAKLVDTYDDEYE